MGNTERQTEMIQAIHGLAVRAGGEILEIYDSEFAVEVKDDRSPLTQADRRSHQVVVSGLRDRFPDIPVISEESKIQIDADTRKSWQRFWLVDPLDGTKEFVKRNGEFTVNIALIEEGFPILGVIYVPVTKELYWASDKGGAWKRDGDNGEQKPIRVRVHARGAPYTVVKSRSHPSKELEEYLSSLTVGSSVAAGSSLKFCLVAEGKADLYPRLGPTMEWDTAAGQAIVEQAGGSVTDMDGERLRYNKETLKNGYFVVRGGGVYG